MKFLVVDAVDAAQAVRAIGVGGRFAEKYPDRVGRSDGVIYSTGPYSVAYYAYRTPKGQMTILCENRAAK